MRSRRGRVARVVWCFAVSALISGGLRAQETTRKPSLLDEALAGPLGDVEHIVYCTRLAYDDPHWYANIGYYCDDAEKKARSANGQPDASGLYKLDIRRQKVTTLLHGQGGSLRDPQVHYDGERILFSYRKAESDHYHLYEINLDGSGLRRITSGEYDDYEPVYLPDGDILFVSTRCKRWVNCWMTQVGVMYRCEADGQNVRPVSANTEHDNTPWVLPDGSILYTRWEYVDRSQVEFHHLWTMNPDGTGQKVFYGNMHPQTVMIDAKPIPGSRKIVASFSPGHGRNEHAGIATVVSPATGPDDLGAVRPLHKGRMTRDPYALSEDCFLVARDDQIVLMNGSGREQIIHRHRGEGSVHEPRPVLKRPRERAAPSLVDPEKSKGVMVLMDVYKGRNLKEVRPGDIRKLLVLESLPKPVNFSGGPDLTSWLGTFTLERVLGTVPVEADGSACFEVPAGRQIFFVALDENDLSVKRMQSFTSVMPGEVTSCVGCHEQRTLTPENRVSGPPQALRRPPSVVQPFEGFPDVLDFHRDIQPILDRHCVKCHRHEKPEGHVVLSGDLGSTWSHSFFSLFAHRQVADGRNGLGNQPPRTIGSSASALLEKVDGSHYDALASPREWRTLWLWIESGAPYAGTYAALRNQEAQRRAGTAVGEVWARAGEAIHRRCGSCHDIGGRAADSRPPLPFNWEMRRKNRNRLPYRTAIHERIVLEDDPVARFSAHILFNFTRPHLSPILLGPLATKAGGWGSCGEVFKNRDDPDYQRLLGAIEAGKAKLDEEPRFSTPGFKPNPQYVRELKKFGVLSDSFDLSRDDIDVFRADQEYWRSFWYRGGAKKPGKTGSSRPSSQGGLRPQPKRNADSAD